MLVSFSKMRPRTVVFAVEAYECLFDQRQNGSVVAYCVGNVMWLRECGDSHEGHAKTVLVKVGARRLIRPSGIGSQVWAESNGVLHRSIESAR